MSDDDEQLRARVAWLYFMEGLTQADIAAKLGMTRLRVNRMLVEARTSGLVGITLNSPFASCIELERALVAQTGLKTAIIVPTPQDPSDRSRAGQATAEFLSSHLEENRSPGSASVGARPCARRSGTCAGAIPISASIR